MIADERETILNISSVFSNVPRKLKSRFKFTALFDIRQCETHSQCVSLVPLREPLKLSLLHSIVFHIAIKLIDSTKVYRDSRSTVPVAKLKRESWGFRDEL